MALRDLLLRRISGDGNRGNHVTDTSVAGKSVSIQSGNRRNRCNRDFGECGDVEAGKAPPGEKTTHATSYMYGYTVTPVTRLKYKGKSGNRPVDPAVTAVTASDPRLAPALGGLVDRVIKAGGKTSIGGHRSGGGLWKIAHVPYDIDLQLVAELQADGWSVQGIEEMRPHVADAMRRAELAVAGLDDEEGGESA